MQNHFEKLVNETMELSEHIRGRDPFRDFDDTNHGKCLDIASTPQKPGVIYRIEKGPGTFCVRASASKNLLKSFVAIEQGDSTLEKKLRLTSQDCQDWLHFFETPYFELAEIICDTMANQRFPLHEEDILGLADPGFFWWGEFAPGKLGLYFNANAISHSTKAVRLGPLGDALVAYRRFQAAGSVLAEVFQLSEFHLDQKKITLETEDLECESFRQFCRIFLMGEGLDLLYQMSQGQLDRTLYFFLNEVLYMRKFWRDIQSFLGGE